MKKFDKNITLKLENKNLLQIWKENIVNEVNKIPFSQLKFTNRVMK